MNPHSVLACLLLCLVAPSFTSAQDIAAERARLANQRIQAEEQRRAQDEEAKRQQEREQSVTATDEDPDTASGNRVPRSDDPDAKSATAYADGNANDAPVGRIEMSRALEQLRELGALKDAGYLTDEEFTLLKQKILDGAL